jgi:hypothetical protein
MSTFQIGTRYEIDPLPHLPGDTTIFPAGTVNIGVEYRQVDDETLRAGFGDAVFEEAGTSFDDSGVSLHVFDASSGAEHLRFDCFDKDAHYHYILWGSHQTIVPFDLTAGGDMLTWALTAVAERLPAMLRLAGAEELAGRVDEEAVRKALAEVEPVARRAQATHRALSV